ncbi:hypothetical protein Tco_1358356, partial [Tanacetum coccineum]
MTVAASAAKLMGSTMVSRPQRARSHNDSGWARNHGSSSM